MRTTLELTVLAVGWLMGGVVGIGTVAYAVAIGPIVHVLLPRLTVRLELVLPPTPKGKSHRVRGTLGTWPGSETC